MKRAAAALVLLLLCAGRDARGDGFGASAEMRIGAATAPFFTEPIAEVESELTQARSMILVAWFGIRPRVIVGGRWPAAPSLVKQPAGSYVDEKAFASPELFVEDPAALRASLGDLAVRAGVRFAVGLPLAQHGPSATLARNQTLAISDALDGWRNPELYTPGVLPFTLSARGQLARPGSRWRVDAALELPVLVRVHDASLPHEARTRAVGFVPHAEIGGALALARWVSVELSSHVAVHAPAPVAPVRDVGRSGAAHLGIEPRVTFALTPRLELVTSYTAAIAGPLRDTYSFAIGLAYRRE
ncbi:MAG TPA: hypothetical protein VMZ28_08660 [Kofleriaceae bacterium]|nr:hypothetical protein [Kofleriaceae bacterium]